MSVFVVDSSTIISITLNCLLDIFTKFHERGHKFIIPKWVYDEVVSRPIKSERFGFEAYRIKQKVDDGVFSIYQGKISDEANKFANYINHSFFVDHHPIKIIHPADSEGIILARRIGDALVVDERNMRMVIENPKGIQNLLQHKLHREIKVNEGNLENALEYVKDLPVLRSVDLVSIAWKEKLINLDGVDELQKVLYSLKFSGCAISFDEIRTYSRVI